MNMLKLCILGLICLTSIVASAAVCETFKGIKSKEKLCFDKTIKGWVSESCLKNKKCQAKSFFKTKHYKIESEAASHGQNPATQFCHILDLEVVVLKDSKNNEQSFCSFEDKSLVDANAIERVLR